MEETVLKYGLEGLSQIFAIATPANILMTVITVMALLKAKEVTLRKEIYYHLGCSAFWAIIFFLYNLVNDAEGVIISFNGAIATAIMILITTTFAMFINSIFRVKIFKKGDSKKGTR